jgi:hypothetical protein
MHDSHEPPAAEQLARQAAPVAARLLTGLQRDSAELPAAHNVPEKPRGQAALTAAIAAARRVLGELEKIRD